MIYNQNPDFSVIILFYFKVYKLLTKVKTQFLTR